MQQFQITLKNEKIRLYNRISWLIIFINFILLLYLALFPKNVNTRNLSIAVILFLTLVFVLFHYLRKTKWEFGIRSFFSVLMLGWILFEFYWLAALMLVFDILSSLISRKAFTIISKKNILFPSFPRKSINWNELNNIILKDGLLTIDYKNNKLFQQVIDESKTSVDEKEFNDFCREQLKVKEIIVQIND